MLGSHGVDGETILKNNNPCSRGSVGVFSFFTALSKELEYMESRVKDLCGGPIASAVMK